MKILWREKLHVLWCLFLHNLKLLLPAQPARQTFAEKGKSGLPRVPCMYSIVYAVLSSIGQPTPAPLQTA